MSKIGSKGGSQGNIRVSNLRKLYIFIKKMKKGLTLEARLVIFVNAQFESGNAERAPNQEIFIV